jgi:hypothetical protein
MAEGVGSSIPSLRSESRGSSQAVLPNAVRGEAGICSSPTSLCLAVRPLDLPVRS